ncbi:TrkH family potassium uptake protein [Luteolibacter sp. AS25]|uniref:TrkH family potassium uptake protein n=1 Tax=Luteolibacter sp. AS25 TaxID=3135776 RepID=UPI00398AA7D8
MNFYLITRILGLLLVLEAATMALCGVFATFDIIEGDTEAAKMLFLSAAITGGFALLFTVPGITKTKHDTVPKREAIVIVGLGWILCSIFGGLPYLLCPPYMSPAGAFFESASGFTTTGSSVMIVIEQWPRGILLWRAVTQLLGGIGILVLFVALLSYIGVSSKSLFQNESSFRNGDLGLARIQDTATMLLRLYLGLVVICLLGLKVMGLTWFNATCHAFTTISTGGLSPHSQSIGYYSEWGNSWLIELWLIIFMALGSLNFLLFIVALRKNYRRLLKEEDAKWFLGLCGLVIILITCGRTYNDGISIFSSLRDSAFIVISIASTTGFGTSDYDQWPTWAKVLIACLMLMGGCSGSTAGGFKVGRLIVFAKSARNEVIKTFRPSQVFRVVVNGNPIDDANRARIMFFLVLYLMIAIGATAVVGFLEAGTGISLESCAGTVLATISSIGPGFDAVGPTKNFAELREPTKVFLGWIMILGRLELFALLVLFVPSLWRKY